MMEKMDPIMNHHQEYQHAPPPPLGGGAPRTMMGYHPPHMPSPGGPPPPLALPYLTTNTAKYPPYRPGLPPPPPSSRYRPLGLQVQVQGGGGHPPPPAIQTAPSAESRYPPSSSARHDDYIRHPPPSRYAGPPIMVPGMMGPPPSSSSGGGHPSAFLPPSMHHPHGMSYPPGLQMPGLLPPSSPGGPHHHLPPPRPSSGPLLPAQSAADVANNNSKAPPHPADKFGKTISVSNRTDIDAPPSWEPRATRVPPPPSSSSSGASSGGGPLLPQAAVPILRTAPVQSRDAVHFSPSKSGAFLPYRPTITTVARRTTTTTTTTRGDDDDDDDDDDGRQGDDEIMTKATTSTHVKKKRKVVNNGNNDNDGDDDDDRASDEEIKAANNSNNIANNVKEEEQGNKNDNSKKDEAEASKGGYIDEEERISNEKGRDDDDDDDKAETLIVEEKSREPREEEEEEEVHQDGNVPTTTTAASSPRHDANIARKESKGTSCSSSAEEEEEEEEDVTMKVSESASKDTTTDGVEATTAISKDRAPDNNYDDAQGPTTTTTTSSNKLERKKPLPITTTTTTALKRPRSVDARDAQEAMMVSVDDDTPRHINIRRHPSALPGRDGGGDGGAASNFHYGGPPPPKNCTRSNVTTAQIQNKRSRFEQGDDGTGRSSHYYQPPPPPTSHYADHQSGHGHGYHHQQQQQQHNCGYPPDLSQMNHNHHHNHHQNRRSYSIESEEQCREDAPTTPGASSQYASRQSYGSYEYYASGPPVLSQAANLSSQGEGGLPGNTTTGIQAAWMTTPLQSAPSREYCDTNNIEPSSYLNNNDLNNYSGSMSWEMPDGTLSAIGSTLSFGIQGVSCHQGGGSILKSPSLLRSPQPRSGKLDAIIGEGGGGEGGRKRENEDDDDDDGIPPLPSSGSLPPRKRAMLEPRPGGSPSSKLFEPPRPSASRERHVADRRRGDGGNRDTRALDPSTPGREGETILEARDPRETKESKYAPATVHDPREQHREHPPGDRGDRGRESYGGGGPPSAVPSYDRRGRYDPGYEPAPPPRDHDGRGYDPRDAYSRELRRDPYARGGGGGERRDPYESPGRHHHPHHHPEWPPHSHGRPHGTTPGGPNQGSSSAPWGSPPHTSSYPHPHHGYPPGLLPHSNNDPAHTTTPGGPDGGGGGDAGSFDSSMSKRSFRSLDDLEDPMQSLLYRPSFSWERGLDVPHHSGHGAHPGGHHGAHPSHGRHGSHGGPHGAAPPFPGHPPSSSSNPAPGVIQLREQQKIMKALTMRSEIRTIGNPNSPMGLILLLAMPQDRHCLSETLCIVRNNVEVFTASEADINAPAPGRKRPIRVGQVGLRCVYCRMCPQRDRVKRATCFPSSMKRIYRAVIDMKLDHFKNCPYVPPGLKSRLDQLQAGSTRSTGMTVQYFCKSAKEMGLCDLEDGVMIDLRNVGKSSYESSELEGNSNAHSWHPAGIGMSGSFGMPGGEIGGPQEMVPYANQYGGHHGHGYPHPQQPKKKRGKKQRQIQQYEGRMVPQAAISSTHHHAHGPPGAQFQAEGGMVMTDMQGMPLPPGMPEKRYSGKVLLSLPEDLNFLSPLRCFLREHVCAFTASARDIAVRTPTTFAVRVGQVGVGCIHCLNVPPKARSNRAVCFPFTVARIYQSVADIQRFHLGECRMMPPDVRVKFLKLQSESAKGSRGLATRTYWVDSAKKIGLADGPAGMYFCRDPSLPPPAMDPKDSAENLDILAQVASNNDIGKVPLVTIEDKPTIAEFLYKVMEQLRPCKFTDADRNKRRSKNLGSIGVECKHCAGKIDGRKFFWSSVSAAESNFVSVHSHMISCKYIPADLKTELTRLKALRREQTQRLKSGSQKAFFTRVWARLHGAPVPATPSKPNRSSKSGKRSPKKIHQPKSSAHKVVIDAPIKKEEIGGLGALSNEEPLDLHIEMGRSHDSDEIQALLMSKSTLSSMPSVDDSIVNHATQDAEALELDLGNSDSELKTGQSSESSIENQRIVSAASKSSDGLTSVAFNLSAVSVHCKVEEQAKAFKDVMAIKKKK